METILQSIIDPVKQIDSIERAAAILRAGGLVAFPTETVYGLGANALDRSAVRSIFEAKGRPQDNPLIAHIADYEDLKALSTNIPSQAKALCDRFWPGPLSLVLRSAGLVAPEVTGGLDTVAVRSPAHPIAQALIRSAGVPIAAPSANLSGSPSPTEAAHVWADLHGRIDCLLDGGPCSVGVESTVLDLVSDPPRILRPGGVTLDQIRTICPDAVYDPAVFRKLDAHETARSPGMKYRHYSPKTPVYIVDGPQNLFVQFIREKMKEYSRVAVLGYDEDLPFLSGVRAISYGPADRMDLLAKNLFSALRTLDQFDAQIIFARCPERSDRSAAVENRLMRAAGHQRIQLT